MFVVVEEICGSGSGWERLEMRCWRDISTKSVEERR